MADLRFSRGHWDARGLAVEREFQGTSLNAIVKERRGAVQIHVINVLCFTAGILERDAHRTRRFITILSEANAMISITRRAVARNLGIDTRAAIGRLFEFFKHVDPRAFAKHDSRSIS